MCLLLVAYLVVGVQLVVEVRRPRELEVLRRSQPDDVAHLPHPRIKPSSQSKIRVFSDPTLGKS